MSNDQVTPAETAEILRLAEICLSVPGDFAEFGCYRGNTSVLLGKILQSSSLNCSKPTQNPTNSTKSVENLCKNLCKNLWIYDSFAGLPSKTAEDSSSAGRNFQQGELSVSKREVVEKLRKHGLKPVNRPNLVTAPISPNNDSLIPTSVVIVKKAWFDDLQPTDLPAEIAFAFLDGDLYSSIKTSLELAVPRLTPQGIIVVHDYNNPELPGSARAVDEFIRHNPRFSLSQRHSLAILRPQTS